MDTNNFGPSHSAAMPLRQLKSRRPLSAAKSAFTDQSDLFRRFRDGIRSAVREWSENRRIRLVFAELSRMSEYELSDIGLSRSDLTLEGLAIAGSKRARKQSAVAREITSLRENREATRRGD